MKTIYILFTLLILPACVSNSTQVTKTDEASQSTPASIAELTIPADGLRMPGLIYQAAGEGPHPTVLLLHGYPGNEKNLDIAQGLRRDGWNVVFFHYRGAWGAEGKFSFMNAEHDVQTVLAYLSEPKTAATLKIDTSKISLVGHSMGGHMAIAGIFDNPKVTCSVAYDPANLGARGRGFFNDPDMSKMWLDYSDTLFMLMGWDGQKAKNEVLQNSDHLNLLNRVSNINGRPMLIVSADTDVIPMDLHITPLVEAINQTPDAKLMDVLIDDDHSFSSSRLELLAVTADFLNKFCR